MTDDWPFADPPNVALITTRRVLDGSRPILLVTHDDDGGWQVLCGTTDDPADARVVFLRSLVARDPGLRALANLPLGWRAWRADAGSPWERGPRGEG